KDCPQPMQWEIPNLRQRESQHGGDSHAQTEAQLRSVSADLCADPVQSGSDNDSRRALRAFLSGRSANERDAIAPQSPVEIRPSDWALSTIDAQKVGDHVHLIRRQLSGSFHRASVGCKSNDPVL